MKYQQTLEQIKRRLISLIFLLLLATSIHHVYGGIIYSSAWRITGTLYGGLICLLIITLIYFSERSRGLYISSVVFSYLWTIIIGYYEGGYNHIIKNILYIIDIQQDILAQMFPAEFGYEIPNDIFFEITGIIQFGIGVLATRELRFFRLLMKEKETR